MGAAGQPVSFFAGIRPIFAGSCWNCHGGAVPLSQLDLGPRDSALKALDRKPTAALKAARK
jgi:hypothetical protein